MGLFSNLCCVCLCVHTLREESQGDVRQWREREHRNNGVKESTSEKDKKSNQSIQLGVYQLFMAAVLFLGKERRGIG